jgi:Holliday junction resolvase RusA-like endonuclease
MEVKMSTIEQTYLEMEVYTEIFGVNQRYIGRSKKVLSREYRAFKQGIALLARAKRRAYASKKKCTFLRVSLFLYTKKDIDNPEKPILDAMNKIIYDDDGMIDLVFKRRYPPVRGEGFKVIVTGTEKIDEWDKRNTRGLNRKVKK